MNSIALCADSMPARVLNGIKSGAINRLQTITVYFEPAVARAKQALTQEVITTSAIGGQATQSGTLDVTPWLSWFLACLLRAVQRADSLLAGVLGKAQFWQRWAGTPLNARQTLVLNHILDHTPGDTEAQPNPAALTNKKWATLAKCSADTALRDITDLLERGMLRKMEGGGRSTGYLVVK
jgi:Fic family protein